MSQSLPGPTLRELFISYPGIRRDPLAEFIRWRRVYGEVISVPVRKPPSLHIHNPDDIRHILTTNSRNYRKSGALKAGRRLFGEGILASDGALHDEQRMIMQNRFTRQHVRHFVDMMNEATFRQTDRWVSGSVIDIYQEMVRLTLTSIGNAFFTTDLSSRVDNISTDISVCQDYLVRMLRFITEKLPTPLTRRYLRATDRINTMVYKLIRERRETKSKPDDLLTALINAKKDDGSGLTDREVRDQVVTLLIAGHETTAIVLASLFYQVSQHEAVSAQILDEIHSVLGNGPLSFEDIPKLQYSEMVFDESMRLWPPVWRLDRMTLGDDHLPSGTRVPEGTQVIILPYVVHRNPEYFPDPETFNPGNFAPDVKKKRRPFVYIPFSAGPRGCLGEHFARTEALVITSIILRRFTLKAETPGLVGPKPVVTLRPKDGILMRIVSRQTTTRRKPCIASSAS